MIARILCWLGIHEVEAYGPHLERCARNNCTWPEETEPRAVIHWDFYSECQLSA